MRYLGICTLSILTYHVAVISPFQAGIIKSERFSRLRAPRVLSALRQIPCLVSIFTESLFSAVKSIPNDQTRAERDEGETELKRKKMRQCGLSKQSENNNPRLRFTNEASDKQLPSWWFTQQSTTKHTMEIRMYPTLWRLPQGWKLLGTERMCR